MFLKSESRKSSKKIGVASVCLVAALSMTATAVAQGVPTAGAQGSEAKCDVENAANFAVQSKLQMLNGTGVNPAKYFTPGGKDSCISGVMLESFDLSNLIPDFMGLLTGAIEGAITSAINGAMKSVCNAANNSVQSTVGRINEAINEANNMLNMDEKFKNLLGSELGYSNVPGNYRSGPVYGVSPSLNPGGILNKQSPSVTTPGQSSGSNALSKLQSSWSSGTGAGKQAVGLAAATEQARMNMDSAWNYYSAQAKTEHASAAYQSYVNAVNHYNATVQAERVAQSGATFGGGNAYKDKGRVTPRQPIGGSNANDINANGRSAPAGSMWSNLFGR